MVIFQFASYASLPDGAPWESVGHSAQNQGSTGIHIWQAKLNSDNGYCEAGLFGTPGPMDPWWINP